MILWTIYAGSDAIIFRTDMFIFLPLQICAVQISLYTHGYMVYIMVFEHVQYSSVINDWDYLLQSRNQTTMHDQYHTHTHTHPYIYCEIKLWICHAGWHLAVIGLVCAHSSSIPNSVQSSRQQNDIVYCLSFTVHHWYNIINKNSNNNNSNSNNNN